MTHFGSDKDATIVDFSFFDDTELAILTAQDSTYRLSTVSLDQASGPLPWRRSHRLGGSAQAPQACAVNGRPGRRVGCVLGGDGRTLELLDMDDSEQDADVTQEPADGAEDNDATEVDENTMIE